jgi:hypothetical protein
MEIRDWRLEIRCCGECNLGCRIARIEEGDAVEEDGMRAVIFYGELPEQEGLLIGHGEGELGAQALPVGNHVQDKLVKRTMRGRDGFKAGRRCRSPGSESPAPLTTRMIIQPGSYPIQHRPLLRLPGQAPLSPTGIDDKLKKRVLQNEVHGLYFTRFCSK